MYIDVNQLEILGRCFCKFVRNLQNVLPSVMCLSVLKRKSKMSHLERQNQGLIKTSPGRMLDLEAASPRAVRVRQPPLIVHIIHTRATGLGTYSIFELIT